MKRAWKRRQTLPLSYTLAVSTELFVDAADTKESSMLAFIKSRIEQKQQNKNKLRSFKQHTSKCGPVIAARSLFLVYCLIPVFLVSVD